jgi:hypothetical protein
MRTARSNEYLDGTTLNELSECHSRLPIANKRWRSSSANTCWFQVGHICEGCGQAVILTQARAGRFFQLPETVAEGQVLLVRQVLLVEHKHGMRVHRCVDRRHILGR